ncbi:phytanoyl-CoA dioxygenase family protein [Novosphingobium sp. M1R2S20]|uniref:Phytanoyl-CoA dioxygenase family protein n=1 Tax=Novosphingobium rhizovicinum TaxID=3228928 RepID=A0ABV3R8N5_9SPHN
MNATLAEPHSRSIPASARALLARDGYCVIERVLPSGELEELRKALDHIASFERHCARQAHYAYDRETNANQRIWNLISRDPLFCLLVEHPLALAFVEATIGWPALLSGCSANIVHRHGADEVLHCDQTYMPEPWAAPHGVNICWCLDAFTAENGATRLAPGSHLLNRGQREGEGLPELVPVEAPAGSLVVIDGRCWHRTGRNETDAPRAGVFNWYTMPIYLPQENWFLSLNPSIKQFGSETLLTLLGFRPQIVGRVNGLSPAGL